MRLLLLLVTMSPYKVPASRFLAAAFAPLVAIAIWVVPVPAAAHVELDSASPALNAQLDVAPSEVVLRFAHELTIPAVEVTVTDRAKRAVTVGAATVDGAVVTQPLKQNLLPEVYQVSYRVISDDGHALTNSYTFTVGSPPALSSVEVKKVSNGSGVWWFFGGAVLFILVGVVAAVVVMSVRRRHWR
ncbi:MAG: copper resistance protein CopC [Corynebacteriales bacterium]|nr:copper resistance protein CopC [Mycobacteriales bacterium]